MTRRRRQGIVFGLVGLLLLLTIGGFFGVRHVENTLTDDSRAWLASQGQPEIDVDAQGREIVLTGTAAPGTDLQALADDLKSTLPHEHDHWWSFNDDPGVRLVNTSGLAVGASEPELEPEATPEPEAEVPTGLVDMRADIDGDAITLSGTVLSEDQRATLVSAAEAEFGADNVTDELRVSDREASIDNADGRVAAVAGVLPMLHNRMNGFATLQGEALTIGGGALDEAAPADIEAAAGALDGVSAVVEVTPPATVGLDEPTEAIETVDALDLRGVQFEYNAATLTPEAETVLDEIAPVLMQYPEVDFLVSGYTDSRGTPTDNLVLSEQRAQAVVNYLVDAGVDADRLTAKGFGVEDPIASNETEEGRAQNRRVELTVLEGN